MENAEIIILEPGIRLEDEYERNAREALRMAENSKFDVDRAAWLRIAQHWLRVLLRFRGNGTVQEVQSGWSTLRDDHSKGSH